MKRILSILVLLALGLVGPANARAGSFLVMGEPYPPYCVSSGLTVKGLAVSALTAIMDMCGTPISDREIKLMPRAYACESAARQPRRILLNARRTPRTEHLYKWVGPVVTARIVLIGRRGDKLPIPAREDLNGYRIATVRWSRSEKALLAGGVEEEGLLRSPSHVQALRRLDSGEADLFACTELGAQRQLSGLGLRAEDFAVRFVLDEEPLYFAFSRDTDDGLIQRLNRALHTIKAAGPQDQSRFDRVFADEARETIPPERSRKVSVNPNR